MLEGRVKGYLIIRMQKYDARVAVSLPEELEQVG